MVRRYFPHCPQLALPALLALMAVPAGCSQAPAYHLPVTPAPAAFAETGPWVPARPAVADARAPWWTAFGDSELDRLEARLDAENPSLAVAYARWERARAELGLARAAALPQAEAGADLTQNRQSDNRPLRGSGQPDIYGAHTVGGEAGYELDLWGRVRDRIAAGRADAEAGADDVAAVRLALEAELASDVIALNGFDREEALLDETVTTYARAAEVTHHRFAGGIANGIDVGRSDAQLADAQAQLAEVRAQRSRMNHAIAVLVGASAADFSLPVSTAPIVPAAPPDVVASALLQRRPDIAAAERRMFAANRRIGVARAAYYPSIMLLGGGGVQSTALGNLFSAGNLFWSLGPSVTVPLFEGGTLRANLAGARADWDEATASYRETVLTAFQEVEDGLSSLHRLSDEAEADDRNSAAAGQAARLSWNRYIKGASNYLDVVVAQTEALTARRHALQVETRRAQASVALVKALGGGWQADGPIARR